MDLSDPQMGVRKRKHSLIDDSDTSTTDQSVFEGQSPLRNSHDKRQRLRRISLSGLLLPPSLYHGWVPPRPLLLEMSALDKLLGTPTTTAGAEDYTYITLSDFCVYRTLDATWHPGTMAPLSDLMTKLGNTVYVFDGVLTRGEVSCFVKNVPFSIVSVEGYEEETVSIREAIYLQSEWCTKSKVWYKLSSPAKHYARFHDSFIWLADFAKHFVCYLLSHSQVCLRDFESKFSKWLEMTYETQPIFRDWQNHYGKRDYRTVVVNNVEYLWKESTSPGVDDDSHNRMQPIWGEIDPKQLEAVPKQKIRETKTVVTPYVYDMFRSMYFGDQLESRVPTATKVSETASCNPKMKLSKTTGVVKIGDVICLSRDEIGNWKDKETIWYAYVHDVERDGRLNDDILHLFWLYRPSDTTCGSMRYPYINELFLSDHCNCECAKSARVYRSEIKEKLAVAFYANSTTIPQDTSYFIRQTYMTEDDLNYFVTLDKSHFSCRHRKRVTHKRTSYDVGDTVLIDVPTESFLEPVEIVSIDHSQSRCRVRKLLRRALHLNDKEASPNELVYTDIIYSVQTSKIVRKCYVRFYDRGEVIPNPYFYGGVGDCWIITGQLSSDRGSTVTSLSSIPQSLNQGFDPTAPSAAPLQILDLFCGGGSFGRGIEDGGAGEVRWACDIDEFAIHTKRANSKSIDNIHLFFGSAVDYFAQAAVANDKASKLIAEIGAVDLIIAGSPCQGFSMAQQAKASLRSRKNASMVALVVAFIDLYRPKYAILENVFGMTRKFGANNDEDVFAQIVCALVGLGYQVQYHIIDAFSQGSPQNRSRIFISIAAAGLMPLPKPPTTHSGPVTIMPRGIGRSMAGVKFGSRQFVKTPFDYVSASVATRDLPSIEDGQVGICVPFPDHRLSRTLGFKKRAVLPWIPTHPYGSSFVQAMQAKLLPPSILEMYKDRINSMPISQLKIFRRLPPNHLFDTCTTSCKPDDARNGRWVHWFEHRPFSIMEAKRAQSFPDHEPLIGLPAQQWKLIGNAVSRYVAAAWGVSLCIARSQNAKLVSMQESKMANVSTEELTLNETKYNENSKGKTKYNDSMVVSIDDDSSILDLETATSHMVAESETSEEGGTIPISHAAVKNVMNGNEKRTTQIVHSQRPPHEHSIVRTGSFENRNIIRSLSTHGSVVVDRKSSSLIPLRMKNDNSQHLDKNIVSLVDKVNDGTTKSTLNASPYFNTIKNSTCGLSQSYVRLDASSSDSDDSGKVQNGPFNDGIRVTPSRKNHVSTATHFFTTYSLPHITSRSSIPPGNNVGLSTKAIQ